jgi:hypothetical protein
VTSAQMACAGLLARGATQAHCAGVFDVSVRTIRRWKDIPAFEAEYQRVLANSGTPDPEGVLIDSLGARTDDSVNWAARQKGALELMALRGQKNGAPQGGHVTMHVHAYVCEKCGAFDLEPPPGYEEGIIDAEATEITPKDKPPPPLSLSAAAGAPPRAQ